MPNPIRIAVAVLCATVCALVPTGDARAGVVLANTRVVFPGDAREVNVRLTNTLSTPVLVEAWIERDNDASAAEAVPFDIVPPLFRMEPGRGQALRVHRAPSPVPTDRESLFWLNVSEIPPVPDALVANAMHIAVRTRVKLFLRPSGLPGSAAKAPDKLTWRLVQGDVPALRIDNPTAFHVTVTRIVLGGEALDLRGDMVRPFGHLMLGFDAPTFDGTPAQHAQRAQALRSRRKVEYLFLNDSGGAERRTAMLAPVSDP